MDKESRALEETILLPIREALTVAQQRGEITEEPLEPLVAMIWGSFVGLIKAADAGYLELEPDTETLAMQACWRILRH